MAASAAVPLDSRQTAAPSPLGPESRCNPDSAKEKRRSREETWPRSEARVRGFVYDGVRCHRALKAGLSRRHAAMRPLPMEDVFLYVKSIDNSDLRRSLDPGERSAWWRMVACGCTLLFLAALCFGPRAWLRQAGYRVTELAERQQELLEIRRHLEVRQAQLTDLRRVGRLAAARGLESPPPENYAWQDHELGVPADDRELAQNFTFLGP